MALTKTAIYWKIGEEAGVRGGGWSMKEQSEKRETGNRREKMATNKISGILKHFSHFFFKGVGGVDTTGLGLGHKLIDLFLNQEKAITIFLASSVGK